MIDHKSLRCAILTPAGDEYRAIAQLLADELVDFHIVADWIGGIGVEQEVSADPATRRPTLVSLSLRIADLVIVDITGDNPNIMYELGVAHALRKHVLIIDRSETGAGSVRGRYPASLEGFLVFQYDPRDPGSLIRYVRLWALERVSILTREVAHGS